MTSTSRRTVRALLAVRRLITPAVLAAAVSVALAGVLVLVFSATLSGDSSGPPTPPGRETQSDDGATSRDGRAGPGRDEVGIHLAVRPDAFGDLEVVERVVSSRPASRLRIAAPPRLADSPDSRVEVIDLQVTADGQSVEARWPAALRQRVIRLPQPATRIELRYRLFGAEGRSEAAPARRVTLSLRPAAFRSFPSAPTVIELRGAEVHNLLCLDAAAEGQLCGIDETTGWRTEPVAARTSRVLALVDLPPVST